MTPSTIPSEPLSFKILDGVAHALRRDRLDRYVGRTYHFDDIGPWLELKHLRQAGHDLNGGPTFTTTPEARTLSEALGADTPACASPGVGTFVLRPRKTTLEQELLTPLGLAAQRSASLCGIPKEMMGRITASLGEMFDNAFEHSEQPTTAVNAFQAKTKTFEFVVADTGIGVLQSLRGSPTYAHLSDHGEALEQAIRPNVSRFERNLGRGHGFDRLIEGMANLNAELRLRAGTGVLSLSGIGQSVPRPTLSSSAMINGFVISAKFHSYRPASK